MSDLNFNLDFAFNNGWSDETLKNIFLNEFPFYQKNEKKGMDPIIADSDEIWNGGGRGNNYGFRDYDFIECADILMAGCSYTWGAGLYERHVWPHYIKQMTGKSGANIGVSGGSTSGAVSRIFGYIEKFGKPKIILCFMPDLMRFYMPLLKDRFITNRVVDNDWNYKEVFLIDNGWTGYNELDQKYIQPKFSKFPHTVTDILPAEIAFYTSIQSILELERYCDAANIKLVWGTWHYETYKFYKKLKNISNKKHFKHMIDFSSAAKYTHAKDTKNHEIYDCHKDLEQEDKGTFYIAADTHHWGSHSQIHIAEIFYEQIKEDNL